MPRSHSCTPSLACGLFYERTVGPSRFRAPLAVPVPENLGIHWHSRWRPTLATSHLSRKLFDDASGNAGRHGHRRDRLVDHGAGADDRPFADVRHDDGVRTDPYAAADGHPMVGLHLQLRRFAVLVPAVLAAPTEDLRAVPDHHVIADRSE